MNRDRINEWGKQVYRDLDDRHMLIPAILLAVAIIAVPLLLGGGSSSDTVATPVPPAAEAAPASMTGSAEVDPVVLTDVPGLRDYHQRLDEFASRNPFKQQMTGGSGGSGDGGGAGGTGSGSTTDSATSTGSTSTGSTSTDTSGTSSTGSTTPTTPPDGGGDVETKYIQITLDVKVGRPGKAKVLEDVDPLSYLPGKQTPVVQYVQGDLAATKAAFVVSPAVVSSEGDGNCDPGRNNCQFLLMKKGDEQHFEYGDKLKVFKLKVLAINRKVIDAKGARELGRDARKASDAAAQFVATMEDE